MGWETTESSKKNGVSPPFSPTAGCSPVGVYRPASRACAHRVSSPYSGPYGRQRQGGVVAVVVVVVVVVGRDQARGGIGSAGAAGATDDDPHR